MHKADQRGIRLSPEKLDEPGVGRSQFDVGLAALTQSGHEVDAEWACPGSLQQGDPIGQRGRAGEHSTWTAPPYRPESGNAASPIRR